MSQPPRKIPGARELRRHNGHRGKRYLPSVVYDAEGQRLGFTQFDSSTGLNSAKVCTTPNEAKLFDYADVRGECPHETVREVVISVWGDEGEWWPSVICDTCSQLIGRKDPYFQLEGDLQQMGRGTPLMLAEWRFWRAAGWPRQGTPNFKATPPGRAMNFPPVYWMNPYLLAGHWADRGDGVWANTLCPEAPTVHRREPTPEEVEAISIAGENAADGPRLVGATTVPEFVSEFRFARGEGKVDISGGFMTREDALEGALTVVFDVQAALCETVATVMRKRALQAQPQLVVPPST